MGEIKKLGLLLSRVSNEVIENEMVLGGMSVKRFSLMPTRVNWDREINYIDSNSDNIGIIAVNVDVPLLLLAQNKDIAGDFIELINKIQQYPHVFFLRDDLLFDLKEEIYRLFCSSRVYCRYRYNALYARDRKNFETLMKKHEENLKRFTQLIKTGYLFEVVLPALFLADNNIWDTIMLEERYTILTIVDALTSLYCDEMLERIRHGEKCEMDSILERSQIERDAYDILHQSISNLRNAICDSGSLGFGLQRNTNKIRAESIISILKGKFCESAEYNSLSKLLIYFLNKDEVSSLVEKDDNWSNFEYKSYMKYSCSFLYSFDSEYREIVDKSTCILGKLTAGEINKVTVNRNVDISRFFRTNVYDMQNDVVFRRYILDGQEYADEFEELIFVFQEYVTKIRGIDISFEKNNTENGVIYSISSKDKKLVKNNFSSMVEDFMLFMSLCDKEEARARDIISSYDIDDEKKEQYLSLFKKKTRRILTDFRHEAERKVLECRQELEDAAQEGYPLDLSYYSNPLVKGLSPASRADYGTYVNIWYPSAPVLLGENTYNEQDKQLIELINKYSAENKELVDELDLLKVRSMDQKQKESAYSKLKQFLDRHAVDIGEIAFTVLMKYISGLL